MNTQASDLPKQDTSKSRKYRRPGLTVGGSVPDALRQFPNMPNEAFVGQPVVEGLFGTSSATVWRHVKTGLIPAPRKFGRRTVWNVGELRQALQAK